MSDPDKRMNGPARQAPPAPVAPVQPDLFDCCRSGCMPCVFDLYEEAMERYRHDLAQYQKHWPAG